MTVIVDEVFESIQGESSYAGLSCFFVRLTGCNLRCKYCDTKYAYSGGRQMSINEITDLWHNSGMSIAEITGGEPLLQKEFRELAESLRDDSRRKILVETNGSQDISVIPDEVVAIVDVKCPGSGVGDSFYMPNIDALRAYDEIKFLLSDKNDYEWAVNFVEKYDLTEKCHNVLFGAVEGILDSGILGNWIVRDKLPVRLQIQLHKIINLK